MTQALAYGMLLARPLEFVPACRAMGLSFTDEQEFAARMLEARGLKFCVDFGLKNVEEKWADMLVTGPR